MGSIGFLGARGLGFLLSRGVGLGLTGLKAKGHIQRSERRKRNTHRSGLGAWRPSLC